MKEVYRIKKGKLSYINYEVPVDFGLVFEEEGLFFFDLYISESFDLMILLEDEEDVFLNYEFTLKSLTEENNEVVATRLSAINVTPDQSKITMQSYGYLSHMKVQRGLDGEILDYENNENPTLFYLELEGLQMSFSELTRISRARGGIEIKDFNMWKRDYTKALLIFDSPIVHCNSYNMNFYKSKENENIIVAFPNYGDEGSSILQYKIFKELKWDFISLLSLLNGAEVAIRKEYIGGFYNDGIGSQEVITYSFKTIRNEKHNTYIPLNNDFHQSNNILNHVFVFCFNKYVSENKKFDLNRIIFYLNGAQKSNRIEEIFFVQIIALERLAQKYVETLSEVDVLVLAEATFEPIKKDLLAVLKKHSLTIGDKLTELGGKIGELHKIKRTSTEYKFLKLLEYARIPLTQDIEKIIDEVRHKTIHHGEIGSGNQGIRNYFVLDELLRDIILNIIGYDQSRVSRLIPKDTWRPRKKSKTESI